MCLLFLILSNELFAPVSRFMCIIFNEEFIWQQQNQNEKRVYRSNGTNGCHTLPTKIPAMTYSFLHCLLSVKTNNSSHIAICLYPSQLSSARCVFCSCFRDVVLFIYTCIYMSLLISGISVCPLSQIELL